MTRVRLACVAALVLPVACVTRPSDPFAAGEQALGRHDLAGALQAFDAVPVAHARYPQARAAALTIERDMRRSHELVLQAMLLRAEWRDAEALDALRQVQEIWPRMPSVDVLVAATRQRAGLFGPHLRPAAPSGEGATPPAPVAEGAEAETLPTLVATQPVDAPPLLEPTPARAAESNQAPSAGSLPANAADEITLATDDAVGAGLARVESQLQRGLLETAVVDLMTLSQRFPQDARVRIRLVRVLHQRGLVRYGEGSLAAAIADWRRVLELDPDHASARQLIRAAQVERR